MGVGIAPDMLNRVFDLFVQPKATLDRSEGGLSVGLTLVKAIIELHGGTITASSDGPGMGSEFTFRLPLASPLGTKATLSKATPLESEPVPNGPLRIAIIEDNADSQTILQTLEVDPR